MNEHVKKPLSVSRRGFLAGAGGLTVMCMLPMSARRAAAAGGEGISPNVFVHIGTDDRIRIFGPAAEMGQGVLTSCPIILAEELDADWDKVDVELSPIGPGYGNPGFGNLMVTGASRTTQGYWPLLRQSGAQARRVLMQAAADAWNVPLGELTTEPNVVVHAASGKRMSYGEAAGLAEVPAEPPQIADNELKPRNHWRLIGHTKPRVDIPVKVNGQAKFGIDQNVDGQLYATILRAPVRGASPDQVDDADAKAVAGVKDVIAMPYGVAVVGDHFDACLAARRMLKVTWKGGNDAASFDSDAAKEEYLKLAADRAVEGVVHASEGDAGAKIEVAATKVTADFTADYLHHATMEPMNSIVSVGDGTAEVWAPTQAPSIIQFALAGMLKTAPDKITVHQTLLGGGYGRKIDVDFVIDGAILSLATGTPVKVIWTREDDVQHDKYRPLNAQRIEAGVDADGNIVGWRHRIVADSIFARSQPDNYEKSGGKDEAVIEGGHTVYAVGDHLLDYVRTHDAVDVGFWRAVGTGYTKFAIEQVVDEIAASHGKDPVQYRIGLLKNDPRGVAVMEKAAEMAGWPRQAEAGRAFGVAFSDDWNTRIAEIVEISLDQDTGNIRVHNVWAAVDPGVAVQPGHAAAQTEGAIVHGISSALLEKITVKNGAVQESNFHDYPVLRLSDVPAIQVEVLQSVDTPGGMGEVALPPVAPAIANAVAQLTGGKRVRQLPMLPERVLAAINA